MAQLTEERTRLHCMAEGCGEAAERRFEKRAARLTGSNDTGGRHHYEGTDQGQSTPMERPISFPISSLHAEHSFTDSKDFLGCHLYLHAVWIQSIALLGE